MNFRSLTWPQVALLIALLAAPIAAYHWMGPEAASVIHAVTTLIAWLTNSSQPPGAGNGGSGGLKLIAGGAAALVLALSFSGCQEFFSTVDDGQHVTDHVKKLDACEKTALDAKAKCDAADAGGCSAEGWAVWRLCKADSGVSQ